MKELSMEDLEKLAGGRVPDASCVVSHGLAGAVSGGIMTAITGPFWAAGVLGGLIGGYAYGLIMCEWY